MTPRPRPRPPCGPARPPAPAGPRPPAAASGPPGRAPTLRLPTTARPTGGAIELTVDPAAERYRGTVRYQVTLAAPTATLWLHAEELQVASATVGGRPARPVRRAGRLPRTAASIGRPPPARSTW